MRRLAPLALLLVVTAARAEEPLAPGAKVGPLEFMDARFLTRRLDDLGERKATVLVFVTQACPLAKQVLPRLVALEAATRERGARFLLVDVGLDAHVHGTAALALDHGVPFPAVVDPDGAAARRLGVKVTPTVVVLDAKGALAYRGRVDDQHRPGGARPAPTRDDLKEALEDVLGGGAVRVAETTAEGCAVPGPRAPAAGPAPTWAQVAPIVERACAPCHREGGEAPFPLEGYQDAWVNADALADVVKRRQMPPWFAASSAASGGPRWLNDRSLTAEERGALLAWVAAGAPLGDPKAAPAPRAPAPPPHGGWRIDAPDLVVSMPKAVDLPADGLVPYRYEVLPHQFEDDTWVAQLEIKADNPRVLHHCNLAYVLPEDGFQKGHFIAGQVPGGDCMKLAPGQAMKIPAGAMLVLQLHHVTTGKPERDRVSVGLRWPRDPVKKQVHHLIVNEGDLSIPPGAGHHEVKAARTLKHDATVLALFTHMHLRGKDMTFTARAADGEARRLLQVPAYAFDWQLTYRPEPGAVRLKKGTRIECVGHFDNSAWNPFNPDPKATVVEGPQTMNEMFFGFVFYTDDAEELDVRVDAATGAATAGE